MRQGHHEERGRHPFTGHHHLGVAKVHLGLTWGMGQGHEHLGPALSPVGHSRPDAAGAASVPVLDGIVVGELDVTLQTVQKFVLPMLAYVGDTYFEDVPADDPSYPPDEVFTGAIVVIKLDGKVIFDSDDDDLREYFIDAQFLDEPIESPEPSPHGPDPNADGPSG